jgi:hypothetical protein
MKKEEDSKTSSKTSSNTSNTRLISGVLIRFDDSMQVDSNQFDHLLDSESFDSEINGKSSFEINSRTVAFYRPMSERQFQNLAPSPGFRDANGGNYAGYLDHWFQAHCSFKPSSECKIQSYKQMSFRQKELEEVKKIRIGDDSSSLSSLSSLSPISSPRLLAERNLAVAEELYRWSLGAKFAANGGLTCSNTQSLSLEDEIYKVGISFFDDYKLKDFMYWIIPPSVEDCLSRMLTVKNEIYILKPMSYEFQTEIRVDDEEATNNNAVLFTGRIPSGHKIVCVKESGLMLSETVLDANEVANRKKRPRVS